ncbi:MAG: septum formation initiator family protein [Candidatus Binataceae bacterium]|nr:septum formation initiator family protein [Candidatus Binataceae bacterium]
MAELSQQLRRGGLTLILVIVVVALAIDCVVGPLGLRDLIALRHDQTQLEATRDKLALENSRLAKRIDRLKTDDRYLERLIRRELGYARPDELVYRYGVNTSNNP